MGENNQVKKNLIFNILSLLANVAVGIFYTPFLVKNLGIVAYGIIPLALIVNQYIGVITDSLTSALTRFYSVALQKNEEEEASKYLSTSFIVVVGFVIFLSIPLFLIVNRIDEIFTIPSELIEDAKLLFTFTILSFFSSLMGSIFNITLYAYNRLDYLNTVKIVRVTFKLLFVIVLFNFLEVNIAYVGISNLLTEIIVLGISIYLFFSFTKGKVKLNLLKFNKTALYSIGGMAGWVILQQIGDTGLYRIDIILINIFWSSKESGILGAFTELGVYSMTIAAVFGSLFGPLILMAYSRNDHEAVKGMTLDRSLSVGIVVAVMVGILCGFSSIILKMWLGTEFAEYSDWLYFKLFLVPFYSAAGVFAFAARAWNKIRFVAIITVILGSVNFLLAYTIGANFNDSEYTIKIILLIGLIFGVVQSYFLNGLYFSRIYQGTRKIVLVNFFKILFVLVIVTSISFFISNYISSYHHLLSFLFMGVTGLCSLIISVKLALTTNQLNDIISLVYQTK